jgi:hypothetical protein
MESVIVLHGLLPAGRPLTTHPKPLVTLSGKTRWPAAAP